MYASGSWAAARAPSNWLAGWPAGQPWAVAHMDHTTPRCGMQSTVHENILDAHSHQLLACSIGHGILLLPCWVDLQTPLRSDLYLLAYADQVCQWGAVFLRFPRLKSLSFIYISQVDYMLVVVWYKRSHCIPLGGASVARINWEISSST